jgi:PAS domain S-box-containing protein
MSSKTRDFESLLEALPDALVVVDHDGVIRSVNYQAELLFGYERGDLIGAALELLVPESLRTAHQVHRQGYVAAPFTRTMGQDLQLHGRRRDGTQFPLDIALSQADTEDGRLVIAAVRDITGREKAEEAHQQSERLAAIVQHSNDAIIAKTLDGIVTSWNPAAEKMYGYRSQEMVGASIDRLSPQSRTGELTAILARIRAGLAVDPFETRRVRMDGTVFPVLLTVSPIRDADGVVVGASTITRDLTQEKEALDAARSMIESSLDALVAISPEGLITDANEATVKATGIPRAELIGTAFSQCFTEPEEANAIYQLVFEKGMAVDYPLTMRHRDGTLTEVLYNASVYRDAGGKVLGVFAAARDVTKQNRAETELAEQRLHELDRMAELERFQRLSVGRELKMIELKKENEYLRRFGPGDGGDLGDLG